MVDGVCRVSVLSGYIKSRTKGERRRSNPLMEQESSGLCFIAWSMFWSGARSQKRIGGEVSKKDPYLDALCSEYIRKRALKRCGGCERCKTLKYDKERYNGSILPAWKLLQWAHFHGKNSHSVRWDIDNAAGLCGGCHMYLDSNPVEKVNFFRELLGDDKYAHLNARKRIIKKPDKKAIRIYLAQKIGELDREEDDGS